jgi:hypothetical protein
MMGGNRLVRRKGSLLPNQFYCMPSQKNCPMKFGAAVSIEGMIIEVPCCGKDCAWFFDNHCAILSIAKELCANQKKKDPKGMAAY